MRDFALLIVAAMLCAVTTLFGVAILTGSVGGSAEVAACILPNSEGESGTSGGATATTVMNPKCGMAASATLPSSPVVNHGLPSNYVIPANASAAETVVIANGLAQLVVLELDDIDVWLNDDEHPPDQRSLLLRRGALPALDGASSQPRQAVGFAARGVRAVRPD